MHLSLILLLLLETGADVEGKIFLGGLTWQTTDEMLKTHFGKWGSLSDVILMRNKITGEPRGFGFVQFQHGSCEHSAQTFGWRLIIRKSFVLRHLADGLIPVFIIVIMPMCVKMRLGVMNFKFQDNIPHDCSVSK